jgi:hypothetical protein
MLFTLFYVTRRSGDAICVMVAVLTVNYKGVDIALRQVQGQYCTCWSAQFNGSDCCAQSEHLSLFEALRHAEALIDRNGALTSLGQGS